MQIRIRGGMFLKIQPNELEIGFNYKSGTKKNEIFKNYYSQFESII